MAEKEYTAPDERENEVKKDSEESKGSDDKERINYRRSTTPVSEDENRILKEIQDNGQAIQTKEGTVRFVDRKTGIAAKDYYHGLLPCEDIKTLLKQNGDYCVRTTEINSGDDRQMCLSVRWENKLRHFLLHTTPNNTWSIDLNSDTAPQFSTVEGLINFYADYKQPFSEYNCRLFTPLNRQQWEFRHAQIELDKKLGEGAFGEVYSGYVHTRKKRNKAAIKTMKCEHVTKDKIEESMAEARLMRRLSHPNVVCFFGVAAEDEPLMIVMEFVKGGSLDAFLEKQANIATEVCVKMCLDAARGLEYLHGKGILHRDLAARNCLYADPTLKISDFGMARAAPEYQMVKHERAPVRWMAPEVLLTKMHTPPSDVWSLGVLFWEIFNRAQEPYEGWPFGKVKREVTKNNYHLSLPNSAPETLKELMQKIWITDPIARISSKRVARSLEAICLGDDKSKEEHRVSAVEAVKEEQQAAVDGDQNKSQSKDVKRDFARKSLKEQPSRVINHGKSKKPISDKVLVQRSTMKKSDKSENRKARASRASLIMKEGEVKLKAADSYRSSVRRKSRRTGEVSDEENQSSKKRKNEVAQHHSEGQEDRENKSKSHGRTHCKRNAPSPKTGDRSKVGKASQTPISSKKIKKKKSPKKEM